MNRVAVVGIGETGNAESKESVSYKEIMFEAALRAYDDAGVDARKDVESCVNAAEDFWEGISIADEYTPDQLGVAMKPVCTVGGDGLHAFATVYMQIAAGLFDIGIVEAHSKMSDVVSPNHIMDLGYDPVYARPLGLTPHFVAGLEMRRFMEDRGIGRETMSLVVEKNRRNALRNPLAAYGTGLSAADVDVSAPVADPLRTLDIAPWADGATVVVLASERGARRLRGEPVWVRGLSWSSDTPALDSRHWGQSKYASSSAKKAFQMSRLRTGEIDVAEVDDTYSYKELQHLEALGLVGAGEAGPMLEAGAFASNGHLPVNPSGGTLGMGNTIEMNGLSRLCEVVKQIRGQAGARQVTDARNGLAFAWRGVPTQTGACVILGKEAA